MTLNWTAERSGGPAPDLKSPAEVKTVSLDRDANACAAQAVILGVLV
jgi:hypothetical protein